MAITFRGGRLPRAPHETAVSLGPHLAAVRVPAAVDWYTGIPSLGMLGNDEWGDCVFAGDGHVIEQQTALGLKREKIVSTSQALAAYAAVTGFDPNAGPPGDNPTDQGSTVQAGLQYLINPGMAGVRIAAFGEVNPENHVEVKQAIWEFGCLSIGMNVPESAMTQFNAGQPWTVVANSPIEGGHCVIPVGYDEKYVYVITWGAVQKMAWQFWMTYVDEAYAPILSDWQSKSGAVSLTAFGEEFARMFHVANPFAKSSLSRRSFLRRLLGL